MQNYIVQMCKLDWNPSTHSSNNDLEGMNIHCMGYGSCLIGLLLKSHLIFVVILPLLLWIIWWYYTASSLLGRGMHLFWCLFISFSFVCNGNMILCCLICVGARVIWLARGCFSVCFCDQIKWSSYKSSCLSLCCSTQRTHLQYYMSNTTGYT